MLLRIRPLMLVLLVLALALPMRLHGLMIGGPAPAMATLHESGHPPCHDSGSENARQPEAGHDHGEGQGHAHEDKAPSGKPGHASLHCATAGMVVPVRPVEMPALHSLAVEALRPAEATSGDGLGPPRQERPPRLPA